ncbi:hypothetical protein N1851_023850 [Merluccius polli]|uniref:Integrase catalytic domain-containing protein n=1 Tax=Merluccius polli TaxID=89951 RepID=A0AA47MG22_MERPO|nr:hypothetical protein N1851_023850 [Merluccius polli]
MQVVNKDVIPPDPLYSDVSCCVGDKITPPQASHRQLTLDLGVIFMPPPQLWLPTHKLNVGGLKDGVNCGTLHLDEAKGRNFSGVHHSPVWAGPQMRCVRVDHKATGEHVHLSDLAICPQHLRLQLQPPLHGSGLAGPHESGWLSTGSREPRSTGDTCSVPLSHSPAPQTGQVSERGSRCGKCGVALARRKRPMGTYILSGEGLEMVEHPGDGRCPGLLTLGGTDRTASTGCKTYQDMQEAERAIICFEQGCYFSHEFTYLRNGKTLSSRSTIHKLDLILDNGILRVGGRINKSAMPMHQKNPIILPKGSHISNLILQHIHYQAKSKVLAPSCKLLSQEDNQKLCILQTHASKTWRTENGFSHVGIDYFGPIEVKRGRAQVKRWGGHFHLHAIHLEMANFLTTDSCINAICRFICRRGSIISIRTDCRTNFVGAQRELQEALKELNPQKIQNTFLTEGIKWVFNPPFGAHHGRIWERLIRLVKKKTSLKQQTLDDETLSTALCEVEAILNDRPITTVSSGPNDLEPLTPNHLPAEGEDNYATRNLWKNDQYSRKRWR